MSCFDALADENFQPRAGDWLQQGARLRRTVRQNADLTTRRTVFLREYAIANANGMGQGETAIHTCFSPAFLPSGLNTAARSMEQALVGFPRFSARLLLTFRLLTPLLTKDDDPFYLFDNPARKDHLLGLPYLSAASLKGLSADAYQRAFPGPTPWAELCDSDKDPDRTRAFRHADPHAKRLFGIADDGVKIENEKNPSEKGRLHFSPVWFNNLQLLVINPSKAETAMGTQPIHFEAVAPKQNGVLEVVYFNPHGIKDSEETTVRANLARWLAAVASWWPVLGLGAKRLAGYGAIEIVKAELQAVGWTGLGDEKLVATSVALTVPEFVTRFTANGQLIDQKTLQAQIKAQRKAWNRQPEVQGLEQEKKALQSITNRNQRQRERDRINRQLAELRKPLDEAIASEENAYKQAVAWRKEHPEASQTDQISPSSVTETIPVIGERTETGPDSWMKLACWIAEIGQ